MRTPLALACALLGLQGCFLLSSGPTPKRRPVNFYLGDARDLDAVRRIMVVPLAGEEMPPDYREDFGRYLIAELGTVERFQVVEMPSRAEEDAALQRSETRGRLSVDAVVEFGKRYRVDGVLFGHVTSFKPYLPPRLGLHLQLVSVHSGEAVWIADGTYDAETEDVRLDILDYHLTKMAPNETLHDWEMIELSPRRFGRYVLSRLVETLLTRPAPPASPENPEAHAADS